MYTYCGNDGVNRVDPSGNIWETIFDIVSLGDSIYSMCTNPSWENAGYLLWDAASLIPGVPGSYVAKVPAKTAKVAKTAAKVSKVGKGTRAASKSLRTASKAKRAKVLYKNKKYINKAKKLKVKKIAHIKRATEKITKKGIKKAIPSKVVNALRNYKSKFWRVSNQTLLLDKKGMKHILERHHPLYWNGTVKATQSFLDKKMTVKDIQDVVGKIIAQNRNKVITKGTNSLYQISGVVDGKKYVVGISKGRIGQFYPK